jgi:hypothetical protein
MLKFAGLRLNVNPTPGICVADDGISRDVSTPFMTVAVANRARDELNRKAREQLAMSEIKYASTSELLGLNAAQGGAKGCQGNWFRECSY